MSFYYIAAYENLESIMEHGILSRENILKKPEISFVDPSEQNCQIRRSSKDLHDFVPLFINPRNAMQYRYLKEGRKIVILEIDEKIVETKGAKISIGNASKFDSKQIDYSLENYKKLDFKTIFKKSWYGNSRTKSLMQSEILIPEKIPTKYIKAIYTYPGSMRKEILNNQKIPNKYLKNINTEDKLNIMFDNIYYKKEEEYSKIEYLSNMRIKPKYSNYEVKNYWQEIEKIL
jgi:hypothetical protein